MQLYVLVLAITILRPSFGAAECPAPDLISPCLCSDDQYYCKDLTSASQLTNVFSKPFNVNSGSSMTIEHSSLARLPEHLFGDKAFTRLTILNCTFSMPSALTLAASKPFLKTFHVNMGTVNMLNLDALGEGLTDLFIYNSIVDNFKGDPFLPNLNKMEMTNNELCSIPVLTRARSVTDINIIDNNCISKSLPANAFANFPRLQRLYLRANTLVSLSNDWLNLNSDSLTHVDLASNDIAYIEPGSFSGLRNTAVVNMTNNALSTLEEKVFRPILSMKPGPFLMVLGNQFVCTCSLAWLFRDPELRAKINDGHCQVPGVGLLPFPDENVSVFNDC